MSLFFGSNCQFVNLEYYFTTIVCTEYVVCSYLSSVDVLVMLVSILEVVADLQCLIHCLH